jgi:hypothetical protein
LTHVVGQSTIFLAAIAIGLLLRFDGIHQDALALGAVMLLNQLAHPLLAFYAMDGFGHKDPNQTVFVLEAAMPVAPLVAVFPGYYDLNTRLASIAIIASLVISPLTIPGLLLLLCCAVPNKCRAETAKFSPPRPTRFPPSAAESGRSGTLLVPDVLWNSIPLGHPLRIHTMPHPRKTGAYHLVALPFGLTARLRRERLVSHRLLPAGAAST